MPSDDGQSHVRARGKGGLENLRRLPKNEQSDIPIQLRGRLMCSGNDTDGEPMVDIWTMPEPEVQPVPKSVRGFRLRFELLLTKPPVWRRIQVDRELNL